MRPLLLVAALAAAAGAQPSSQPAPPAPEPGLDCRWLGPKEFIEVHFDDRTGFGQVFSINTSAAPRRDLRVTKRVDGDVTSYLFDRYLPEDSTSLGRAVPRKEHLVRGKSVVARVVLEHHGVDIEVEHLDGGLELHMVMLRPVKRLHVDADVDLAAGMHVRPSGGGYVCGH